MASCSPGQCSNSRLRPGRRCVLSLQCPVSLFRASPAVAGDSQAAVLQACMPLCPMSAGHICVCPHTNYRMLTAAPLCVAATRGAASCSPATVGHCWPACTGPQAGHNLEAANIAACGPPAAAVGVSAAMLLVRVPVLLPLPLPLPHAAGGWLASASALVCWQAQASGIDA